MDDASLGALVFIAFVIIVAIWAMKGSGRKDLDREREDREHELEMMRLNQKREELERQRSIPSGRGKVVKARRG